MCRRWGESYRRCRVFRRPRRRGLDARFYALSRRYAYRVSDAATGVDPLRRHEVLDHRRPLDVVAMDAAAVLLLGEQTSRRTAADVKRLDRRRLAALSWQASRGGLAVATVEADAF